MANCFSIHAYQFTNATDEGLREEIRAHTGCEEEAASILRSIQRLGSDPSIRRYEMTPAKTRAYARATRVNWSVRAVRPEA
jgi:hypothetical protein